MVDEREDPMDLDLNLEPSFPPPRLPSSSDVLEERFFRERIQRLEEIAARSRGRWRRRWREGRLPPSSTADDLLMEVIVNAPPSSPPPPPPPPPPPLPLGIQRLLIGEGSVRPAEERSTSEICKSCKGRPTHLIAKALEKEKGGDDLEKESDDLKVCFFDCNICFDMASDPVLTSCGHLFCWGCLYQWINVHSDTKECPVCKGEVTEMNITPIYGRGGGGGGGSSKTHEAENIKEKEEEVKELKIPPRPHARRIESLRQSVQRVAEPSFTIEELLQQYDSMFDVYRGFNRTTRIPEQLDLDPQLDSTPLRPLNDIIDLTQDNVVSSEAEGSSRRNRVRRRPFFRPHLTTRASASYLPSSVTSGERSVESYIQGQPVRRNQSQSQSPPIDDRDSFSSIVAVMNSDSQTVDTAIEIDSIVSPTPSSSRRRRDTSSVSDVNHVLTRSSRRRR